MKKLLLSVCFATLISMPAASVTMEQNAFAAGKLFGGYQRARALCLAKGIQMPNHNEMPKEQADTIVELERDYEQFFAMGYREGERQANALIGARDLSAAQITKHCTLYRDLILKK